MSAPIHDLAGRDDLEALLRDFYGHALEDPLLRHIFVDVAHMDLEAHLPVICDFWQKVLFNVGTYNGQAMTVHRRINDRAPLTAAHFDRWLALWGEAIDRSFAGPVADAAKAHAKRMAAVFLRQLTEPRGILRSLPLVARGT
jgi:hemoglobin